MTEYKDEICKYYEQAVLFVQGSSPFIAVLNLIENAENKNTLKMYLFGQNFEMTYTDRKYVVYGLTLLSLFKRNFRPVIRRAIPFYVFYSLLICRENLNPYL